MSCILLRFDEKSTILCAILSPISSTLINSSKVAAIKLFIDLKCFANFLATVSPTKRIPRANSTFSKGISFDFSIPEIIFCADFSAIRSKGITCATFKSYKSA